VPVAAADRWSDVEELRYPGLSVDLSTGVVLMEYELRGATSSVRFTETITFPVPDRLPDEPTRTALTRVLELLYLAGGTSYYKLAAPRRVILDSVRLAEKALPWITALYRKGLAEFAYRNGLPHVLDVPVEAETGPDAEVIDDRLSVDRSGAERSPLVAVGGGKDSIVSIEALKLAGHRPVLFAVKPNPLIRAVMAASGCPVLPVARVLDPKMFQFNAEGGYNGHIPVTAINSLVGVAAALLHGYGPVVMSNERSASTPNLSWLGHEVNHQWSKGIDAEAMLNEALAAHAGVTNGYFSLLRGLSELHIARLFAPIDGYDSVVSSCNAAFRIGDENPKRWCGACDKCRFVFLALAPFVARDRLVRIFGADLLADPDQLPGYRELCGLFAHKPFECVGETEECLVALALLADHAEWSDAVVVQHLRTEVPAGQWPNAAAVTRVFDGGGPHYVPGRYARVLSALAGERPD
jgi:hypothetical protein